MPARNGSLRDQWRSFRNRLIANPGFRDWAARFPLTRRVARGQARALFDIMAGFVYTQVLLACVKTGLLAHLSDGPRSAGELAAHTGLPEPEAERLVRAAVSLGLAERAGRDYALGMLGAAFLADPALKSFVLHHEVLYGDLTDPVALLSSRRETGMKRFWAYAKSGQPQAVDPGQAAAYSTLMAQSQRMISTNVLHAYDFARHRHLLDIGGGEGAFAEAVARQAPHLAITLFDLPAVAARARERFAGGDLATRITTVGGNFHDDPLPKGADVVSLVRVLHDHDDVEVLRLLKRAREALGTGGTLLIAEPMSQTPGAEPIGDAYFGFYLLAMGSGRPRAPQELFALAKAAGFSTVILKSTATPMLVRLIVATT